LRRVKVTIPPELISWESQDDKLSGTLVVTSQFNNYPVPRFTRIISPAMVTNPKKIGKVKKKLRQYIEKEVKKIVKSGVLIEPLILEHEGQEYLVGETHYHVSAINPVSMDKVELEAAKKSKVVWKE